VGREDPVLGIPAYVYFDNDFMAYAARNAMELREALSGV
jgi:uncharacterized protein YecE (DUF72 family)